MMWIEMQGFGPTGRIFEDGEEEAEKELDKNFEANGKTYLVRCPKCGKENYALAVSSGVCCWCGYDANKDHKTGDKKELDKDKQV